MGVTAFARSGKPLLIYLGDLTYTTLSLATDAFPLNVGFIAAYAKKIYGNDIDVRLFKYIPDLEQALAENPPHILGLSNYPWNFNLGLEFFRMAHAISPETICVMGGPNIPLEDDARKKFIRRYPEIDFYAYLEGEEAFVNLIARAMEAGVDRQRMRSASIDGFIHRVSDSEVMCGTMLPRRRDLDEIPSPYLTGLMDKFFDGILSPMMETNRGCPFSCSFCHEGNSLISKVNQFSLERDPDGSQPHLARAARQQHPGSGCRCRTGYPPMGHSGDIAITRVPAFPDRNSRSIAA